MVYYVTAETKEKAQSVAERLQRNDLTNCYISPLAAISCMDCKHINQEAKNALRLDLLTICDALIVCSKPDYSMRAEIRLAHLIKMEVQYLDI